jgi:DNA-directed RNA polymerase specialized sigma subunit
VAVHLLDKFAEEIMLLEKLSTTIERELTNEQRNVLVLRFQDEFGLKETAEIAAKNVNAVNALQNRGINKLREILNNGYGGEK